MWISKKTLNEIKKDVAALKDRVEELEGANSFKVYPKDMEVKNEVDGYSVYFVEHFKRENSSKRITHEDAIKKIADHIGIRFELTESKEAEIVLTQKKKPATKKR